MSRDQRIDQSATSIQSLLNTSGANFLMTSHVRSALWTLMFFFQYYWDQWLFVIVFFIYHCKVLGFYSFWLKPSWSWRFWHLPKCLSTCAPLPQPPSQPWGGTRQGRQRSQQAHPFRNERVCRELAPGSKITERIPALDCGYITEWSIVKKGQ